MHLASKYKVEQPVVAMAGGRGAAEVVVHGGEEEVHERRLEARVRRPSLSAAGREDSVSAARRAGGAGARTFVYTSTG